MNTNTLTVYAFNLGYTQMLMKDIPDEQIADVPHPGMNHPAWVLGHLAVVTDGAARILGDDNPQMPAGWKELFTGGSVAEADRSKYPSKDELLTQLSAGHERVARLAADVAPERLAAENPNEFLRPGLPTVGDMLTFMMTSHESIHLGQHSAWRRVKGMPSAIGR